MDLNAHDLASSHLSLNNKLYYAIANNWYDYAAKFIKEGADVNHYQMGSFPLLSAVTSGNIDIVKLLVENGANINLTAVNGSNSLLQSVIMNNTDMVKYLVSKGVKINIGGSERDIPLIVAIKNQNFDIVKVLVDGGADINWGNNSPPLYYAIKIIYRRGTTDILKYLLEHGVDVNAKNIYGESALTMVAHFSHNMPLVKLLLEYGANWRDIRNKTVLQSILKDETTKVREELFQSYLAFKRVSPKYRADGKSYSEIPKDIVKSLAYEKIYSDLCTVIPREYPPLKLVALAIVLDRDYKVEINESWSELCQRVSRQIKPTYYPENKK
jgi:ankyrin repeat protein